MKEDAMHKIYIRRFKTLSQSKSCKNQFVFIRGNREWSDVAGHANGTVMKT